MQLYAVECNPIASVAIRCVVDKDIVLTASGGYSIGWRYVVRERTSEGCAMLYDPCVLTM